jgi:hypothetical protein
VSRDFRRRKRERPVKTTFLIVCEGSCEEIYFKNLKKIERLPNLKIDIHNPKKSTPVKIIDYAKKKQKEYKYDIAFCLIDGDVLRPGDIKPSTKIEPVISYPCFEVWLLLHFEYTSTDFYDCKNLIDLKLKKYIADYEKSQAYHRRKNFYGMLKDNIKNAINNAKRLDEENKKNCKPSGTSSGIYKIIEKILDSAFQ